MAWLWLRQTRTGVALLSGLVVLVSGSSGAQEDDFERLLQKEAKAAADARAEADVAKAKQKLAEQETQAASGDKAVAENAKLLKSGITVGISAGLQFPIGSTKGTSLQNAAFVAMPYVAFFPGYWGGSETLRQYCVSEWGGSSETDASAAAMEIARRKASNRFDAFVSAMNAGATDAQILEWDSSDVDEERKRIVVAERNFELAAKNQVSANDEVARVSKSSGAVEPDGRTRPFSEGLVKALGKADAAQRDFERYRAEYAEAAVRQDDADRADVNAAIVAQIRIWLRDSTPASQEREASKKDIIRWIAEQDWKSTLRGNCWKKRIGVFLGRPLNHEVRVKVGGLGIEKRDYVPQLAFGGTFTPNAYVSVLVGLTVGNVEVQGSEGTPRDPRTAWAGNVSVGGNFDLAAALFKGAQSIP
ncbi:hypothetical protein OV207_18075 [Corallococcus sp. BB11-1]|uniref:hypothetical protein n=1 Tax=Corallococcus sp. BB11-1 TaxID=2996783 RepID=UPI00226DBEDE|nr:hypothetical protein [Corallococcus sp. BB11-1]MCY1033367.1 hypothetical protein [Corallococcus sp. BB11-1]